MNGERDDIIREEVSGRLGREISDAAWGKYYGQAKRKLQDLIARFGDEGGARRTIGYITDLVIEAIQAEAFSDWTHAMYEQRKNKGAGANADPQGHTNILPQQVQISQEILAS